ncbi:MAG: hypothetical protein ABI132_11800 [Rhodanobacteraceae bacterium]
MSGRQDPPSRDPRARTEPVFGDLDNLDALPPQRESDDLPSLSIDAPRRARTAASSPPRRAFAWVIGVVIAIVVLGGVWVWSHQNTLRADLPRTQLNSLLTRADQALGQGKLSGSPDSARDLYEAALALDPDSEQALGGLRKVGAAELARAKQELNAGKLDDARAALEEARGLLGGGSGVAEVDAALAKSASHGTGVETSLDQAQAALAAGRIDGRSGAAGLYRRVLAAEPGNAVARHGLDQVGDALAARVKDQLARGDRAGAQRTLDRLAGLLPSNAQLPALRAAIAQAEHDSQAQRDRHLAQGETDLRAGKFTGTGNDNALAQFQAVLADDPGNAGARQGLGQVAQALIVRANAAIDSGNQDDAKQLLDAAGKLAPKSADLAAARSRMHASARTPRTADAGQPPFTPALSPALSAKVARLVRQANNAAHRGELMLPPGDSAYDLYRAALAIDGGNAQAQAGLQTLPRMAHDLFGQAMHGGRLQHAGDLLATLAQLSPGDPALSPMQQDLGSAWIDRARKLGDQGRYDDARRALDEARRLAPGDPRIDETDARIGYGN